MFIDIELKPEHGNAEINLDLEICKVKVRILSWNQLLQLILIRMPITHVDCYYFVLDWYSEVIK